MHKHNAVEQVCRSMKDNVAANHLAGSVKDLAACGGRFPNGVKSLAERLEASPHEVIQRVVG